MGGGGGGGGGFRRGITEGGVFVSGVGSTSDGSVTLG